MNHIEQAYKAWRATVVDMPLSAATALYRTRHEKPRKYAGTGRWKRTPEHREIARKAALKRWATPSKRARNAVTSYWATLTPEQRSERQRKAAKKMWKRRKAEAR